MTGLPLAGRLHGLLLRAAGRIPDDDLTTLRLALAGGHSERCAAGLADRFPMTAAELETLREAAPGLPLPVPVDGPVDEPPDTLFVPVPPDTLTFYGDSVPVLLDTTGETTATDAYDLAVLTALDLDDTVGVWRGWRVSLREDGASAARVYVVETTRAAEDLPAVAAAVHSQLAAEGDTTSQVEVYGPGLPLPAYQWTARAHAALIWAAGPAPDVRIADPGADAVPLDGDDRAAALRCLRSAAVVAAPPDGPAVRTDGWWVWPETFAEELDRTGALTDPDLAAHLRAVGYEPAQVDAVAAHRALAALQRHAGGVVVDDGPRQPEGQE